MEVIVAFVASCMVAFVGDVKQRYCFLTNYAMHFFFPPKALIFFSLLVTTATAVLFLSSKTL